MANDVERRKRLDSKTTPIAISHAGMYVYANPAFLRLLGYERFSEIEGIPVLDMVSEHDRSHLRERLRLAACTGNEGPSTTSAELSLIAEDGEHLVAEATVRSLSFEGETCVELRLHTRPAFAIEDTLSQAPWRAYLGIAFLVLFTLLPLYDAIPAVGWYLCGCKCRKHQETE